MAEKPARNPRTIAEKLGEPGGSGKGVSYCGTCGLPSKDCLCASQKNPSEKTTNAGIPVGQKMPAKFGK